MNNVIPFNFNSHAVRVIKDDNGEPWFVAMDVSVVLDYSDAYEMTKRLDPDEKQNRRIAGSGFNPKGTILINEAGLYTCILTSQKPEAKPFKRWVSHEVLPSIRKTGQYTARNATAQKSAALDTALDRLRTANALKLAEETAARLCDRFSRLGENAQMVIYAKIINPIVGDEVLTLPSVTETLRRAGEVGELLGVSGNKIGRLSNQHDMKTPEYGEYRLDKSEHSSKQVETFHYNAKAIEKFQALLAESGNEKVVPLHATDEADR